MKYARVNFALTDAWEEWLIEVPDDADEDWINDEANLDTILEHLVAITESGNYGMEITDVLAVDVNEDGAP
jgi:hypothetical protein